jgi:hypothetical protein
VYVWFVSEIKPTNFFGHDHNFGSCLALLEFCMSNSARMSWFFLRALAKTWASKTFAQILEVGLTSNQIHTNLNKRDTPDVQMAWLPRSP